MVWWCVGSGVAVVVVVVVVVVGSIIATVVVLVVVVVVDVHSGQGVALLLGSGIGAARAEMCAKARRRIIARKRDCGIDGMVGGLAWGGRERESRI